MEPEGPVMEHKGYKLIPVTDDYSIAIPEGLPPDQEAALIATRLAEFDPIEMAAECKELRDLRDHPEKCIPLEDVLREMGITDLSLEEEPK
jgi:hypothetical protein